MLRLLFGLLLLSLPQTCFAWDSRPKESSESSNEQTVALRDLPLEVSQTIERIERGAPLRFRHDGSVFGNYDGHLPRRPKGYYHEYTVQSEWRRRRGARRLIVGRGGEYYYTADHYETFRRIAR